MRVVTWISKEDGAVARIEVTGARGKPEWLPVTIHAATARQAEADAREFFGSEQERIARQSGLAEKRRAAAKKSAEVRRKS